MIFVSCQLGNSAVMRKKNSLAPFSNFSESAWRNRFDNQPIVMLWRVLVSHWWLFHIDGNPSEGSTLAPLSETALLVPPSEPVGDPAEHQCVVPKTHQGATNGGVKMHFSGRFVWYCVIVESQTFSLHLDLFVLLSFILCPKRVSRQSWSSWDAFSWRSFTSNYRWMNIPWIYETLDKSVHSFH